MRGLQIEGSDDELDIAWEELLGGQSAAATDAQIEATQQLDALMKTSAMMTPRPGRSKWLVATIVGFLFLGGLLAYLMRPDSLLKGADPSSVPHRKTAKLQLYHAKLTDSELAWMSVAEFFPGDTYEIRLANQGLVRRYLWQTGEIEKALPLLDEFIGMSADETQFRGFGLAGKFIALSVLGRREEARVTLAQLTPEMLDRLDARMRRELGYLVSRDREAMNRQTAEMRKRLMSDSEVEGID